jgi:hypothetical protein
VIRNLNVVLFIALATTIGCQSASRESNTQKLSESEALSLAVELANKECESSYSSAPFTLSSYSIEFRDGRWHWGSLDLAGDNGFSAVVSFGPRGEDRQVEVFLSTDKITPLRDDNNR